MAWNYSLLKCNTSNDISSIHQLWKDDGWDFTLNFAGISLKFQVTCSLYSFESRSVALKSILLSTSRQPFHHNNWIKVPIYVLIWLRNAAWLMETVSPVTFKWKRRKIACLAKQQVCFQIRNSSTALFSHWHSPAPLSRNTFLDMFQPQWTFAGFKIGFQRSLA